MGDCFVLSSVVREWVVSVELEQSSAAPASLPLGPLRTAERARASCMFFQATKSQRWMPWRREPMKDVGDCEKPRVAVDQALIRGCPNGETRHPSWGVTLV
jgi:hypothetical protein